MSQNISNKPIIDNQANGQENENQINVSELLFKVREKWYLFAIAVAIALILAFFVNRYATPKYEASSTLLIKTNNDMLNSLSMGTTFLRSGNEDFQNAIGTIQSYTITKQVLKTMNMYVSYYQRLNFRYDDIYKDSPFEVILDITKPQPTNVNIKVKILDKNTLDLSYDAKSNVSVYDYVEDKLLDEKTNIPSRHTKLKLDEWYNQDGMRFKIQLVEDKWDEKNIDLPYAFMINNLEAMAEAYNSTKIDLINKESSIVTIKFKDDNPKIAIDFVNTLCQVYIDRTFEEKNYLNVATIDFVNNQIVAISDSLTTAEAKKESFKEAHNTLNLTNDGQYLYEKSNKLQEQKASEYAKRQYYAYLTNYINTAKIDEGIASPEAAGVTDVVLNTLIGKLSDAIIEYKTASSKRSEKNPRIKELRTTIETIRNQISESLKSIKEASNIIVKELDRQQNELQLAINKLPSTERNMINIERQFKFNDEIYSFLYQKRADAEIAKNAALPDHKIIDKASVATKVYPRTALNFLIAFVLGLLVPGAYIFIKYITKDTIDSKDDLQKISQSPILGYIPRFPEGSNPLMVFNKPKSQITECYRTIRTNVKYILEANKDAKQDGLGNTILVTSSMPSEGKSLTSVNIASVFSINKSKTLLLECDLRKPKYHKTFGLDASKGIVSYYIDKAGIDDIIQHTEFDNFDVVCVGQVPPNPSEIIDSEKMKTLIEELKKRYDYIVLDTPPVNLIADAQTLAKQVDVVLYMVRLGQTSASILRNSLVEMEQRSNVKVNFILNYVETLMQKYGYGKVYAYGNYGYGGKYGYGYGGKYGYGTSYGYGYFDDEASLKHSKKSNRNSRKKTYGIETHIDSADGGGGFKRKYQI
ncbi:MAG: polysaccharide biosynthesis tyrosine autokinase [Bacteroidota bacterium]|nr:polysaccharide biosynthesis tyrosine autokinase [Bacteroidota bacterium]